MEIEEKRRNFQPPNGGYGWIIVLCAAVGIGFVSSVIKSAGLIYVMVLDKYPNTSRELVATMTTVVRGIMFLIGIISVNLAECYSYKITIFLGGLIASIGLILCAFADDIRLLICTFGVITGIGTGLIHAPCIVITGSYFTSKRSTAMGLMLCLSGTIIALMPIVLQFFMDIYGLQGAFLLWGGLMLQICVIAQLIRQPNWVQENCETSKLLSEGKKINFFSKLMSDLPLFKNPIFLLLLANRMAFFVNNVAVLIIIPDFVKKEATQPIPMEQSALLLSGLIFGDVISRGLSGFVLDWVSSHKTAIYLLSLLLTAWFTLVCQWTTTLIPLAIVCVLYGIVTGTALLLTYLLVFDYFPNSGEAANALQQSVTGVILLFEGPIIGGLWSLSKNYTLCWDFLALIIVVSGVAWIFKKS